MAEVDVFNAIANSVRRALLDALASGPLPVHDLAQAFPISRPAISQHLRVLLDARLVMEERVGRERRYRLDPAPLREVDRWVSHYQWFWRGRLQTLGRILDETP